LNQWVQGPRRQRYLGASQISSSPATNSKQSLRRELRARRRALSPSAQRRAARQLLNIAVRQPWFVRAQKIAVYWPADGEIDPRPLLHYALSLGKQVFLPRLRPGNQLQFVSYKKHAAMRRNYFGIPEPLHRVAFATNRLDVICLPLVGFDRHGGRLGMGGGFYDRTLARCVVKRRPLLIGLAHSFQEVERLPCESWDIPLAGIITEREWIASNRQ